MSCPKFRIPLAAHHGELQQTGASQPKTAVGAGWLERASAEAEIMAQPVGPRIWPNNRRHL